uniref:Uncharacterized protein n=1 Tax=Moniliophthora roreri TaxID=221103 RepID=A0A0W0FQA3_MONRR
MSQCRIQSPPGSSPDQNQVRYIFLSRLRLGPIDRFLPQELAHTDHLKGILNVYDFTPQIFIEGTCKTIGRMSSPGISGIFMAFDGILDRNARSLRIFLAIWHLTFGKVGNA